MIPKISDYFESNFLKEFSLLNEGHRKEILIGINVLKSILKTTISNKTVKDRFIKYDEDVREE